ncbi:MAG TPA: NAD(+)/NADH kinase [Gemmatimonadaceae bacterium]|nr:NAD(+)/NADH kinase [Gemmatimonadaceae bacterium]
MKRIGVVGNRRYEGLADVLHRLRRAAPELGFSLAFEPDLHDLAGGERLESPEGLDALVTLGGDGTMLRGARYLAGAPVPLLGINLGRLGFLTCCSIDALERALGDFAAGHYRVEQRMALEGHSDPRPAGTRWRALNDIVLHKAGFARVVHLRVAVNGEPVATFAADGLIISTPTGSTGYNLSAGGAVVEPTVESIIITPVSAHALALRPVVLPPHATIAVSAGDDGGERLVTVDGQVGATISPDDTLIVERAAAPVLFVRFLDSTFFAVMRQKLGWGGLRERDETKQC